MDLGKPQSAVCPTLEGDVLVVLAGTKRALTGRDVARLARRGSQRGVLAALDRLVLQGTVHRSEAGRSHLFALNWDHVAAPAVQVLAGLRSELIRRIRTQIADWELRPIHVSLFGSLARGEGNVDSDVDLLVV